jgi:Ca2+-binding EF-hand superfamily protein
MLTPFQHQKLTYLFNLLDINNNGILQLNDFAELAESVRAMLQYEEGKHHHQEIVRKSVKLFHKLLRDIPYSENQSIGIQDWLSFFDEEIVNAKDLDVIDEYVELFLVFIFGLFDENKDGYISIDEYQEIFNLFGIDKGFSKEAFMKIDRNGDNRLSKYELAPAMEIFFTSSNETEIGNWIFGDWR